jgi:hypothetical protein
MHADSYSETATENILGDIVLDGRTLIIKKAVPVTTREVP